MHHCDRDLCPFSRFAVSLELDVSVNGAGTNRHVYGSIVGKAVTMTGVSNLHYDERLGSTGMINNYKILSWFEDNR
jgi:hypothetical protein